MLEPAMGKRHPRKKKRKTEKGIPHLKGGENPMPFLFYRREGIGASQSSAEKRVGSLLLEKTQAACGAPSTEDEKGMEAQASQQSRKWQKKRTSMREKGGVTNNGLHHHLITRGRGKGRGRMSTISAREREKKSRAGSKKGGYARNGAPRSSSAKF